MNELNYRSIERAFKKLYGNGQYSDPDNEGQPYLTEKNFTQNIQEVTGTESEFFGKMLYLYFSNGLDKVKITMQRFFEGLKPYTVDEERQRHAQTTFRILDIDHDGTLNVINLLHLYTKIPTKTRLGQELFKVIEWFLDENTKKKSILQKIDINLEKYLKINCQKMCLTSEMRTCFLGIPDIKKTYESGDALRPELQVH